MWKEIQHWYLLEKFKNCNEVPPHTGQNGHHLKVYRGDFSGGPVVKNPIASHGHGFDPTYSGATNSIQHNYWSPSALLGPHAVTTESACYWVRGLQLLKPKHLKPVLSNKRSHWIEKLMNCNEEHPTLTTLDKSTAMKSIPRSPH